MKGNRVILDEDYVETRESFIPEAENYANELCGSTRPEEQTSDQWAVEWNKAFHRKMEELVRECYQTAVAEWIVGSEACRKYLKMGSWKSAKRWIKKYGAPLRYWVDGRPVFLKAEIDAFLAGNRDEKISPE